MYLASGKRRFELLAFVINQILSLNNLVLVFSFKCGHYPANCAPHLSRLSSSDPLTAQVPKEIPILAQVRESKKEFTIRCHQGKKTAEVQNTINRRTGVSTHTSQDYQSSDFPRHGNTSTISGCCSLPDESIAAVDCPLLWSRVGMTLSKHLDTYLKVLPGYPALCLQVPVSSCSYHCACVFTLCL